MTKKKTALVAGGAGFLGSHIVERLISEGWNVRVVDLPSAPFDENLSAVRGAPNLTIEEKDLLSISPEDKIFEGVDEIFHCIMAGNHITSKTDPEPIFSPNLLPTIRVLEAARHHPGTRVHNTSSGAVYGDLVGELAETDPLEPNTPYGLVKLFQEQAVAYWSREYKVPAITCRLFACYGPRVTSGGVFGVFLQKIREGKPLTLAGDGESERDFVYVKDVVDAFVRAANSTVESAVYNVGSGRLHTIKTLATLMGGPIEHIEGRPVDEPIFANIDRITSEIGWRPTTSLEDGVAEVMQAIRNPD